MSVQFADETISIASVFGPLCVTITGDALHVLWVEGAGPEYGAGLMAANLATIEQIATMKFEADEGEADHSVLITDLNLES